MNHNMDYSAAPAAFAELGQPAVTGMSETGAALAMVEELMRDRQGHCVSDLQRVILREVLQGRRYREIADCYGCTEGHAKDVGSQLWKSLSELLGEKVTKRNLRSVVERCRNKARRVKRRLQSIHSSATMHHPALSLELEQTRQDWAERDWADTGLIGRRADLSHLAQLMDRGQRAIVIQGAGGLGKTTLAQAFLSQALAVQEAQMAGLLELTLAKEPSQVVAAEQWVEDWLQQQFDVAPKAEFARNLALLKQQLQNQPFGILIDNLESALDGQSQFLPGLRGYGELLRMLAQIPSIMTLVTSRDRLCEPTLTLHHYALSGLDRETWATVFEQQGIQIDSETLHNLHHTYGGNAKAMGLVSAAIATDFGGDGAAYWQLHQHDPLGSADLSNLIEHQILRLQQLDNAAYRLFCRLGCYREQGGPPLRIAELRAMLWDVPVEQQLRLIDSLRRRSLLEHHQGCYHLHPALRAAAIARLRASPDWEQAHHQATQQC